jgi:hypothetical protein
MQWNREALNLAALRGDLACFQYLYQASPVLTLAGCPSSWFRNPAIASFVVENGICDLTHFSQQPGTFLWLRPDMRTWLCELNCINV